VTLPHARPADALSRAWLLAPDDAPRDGVRGLVSGTIPFSMVDGPGNRFTVFLQGCNMDCLACHNPYTIRVCDDCAACVDVCPTPSLQVVDGAVRWNPATCIGCDDCIAACPSSSTPKTRSMTPQALVEEMRPVAPFLSGVTVSGGEATQQAEFVQAFFAALAAEPATRHLTRFVDSNGLVDEATWVQLDGVMDGAMIDLKAFDDETHQALTGTSNASVLASIERLAQRGTLHEVRLLMIPGRNDDLEGLERTGAWLHAVDPAMRVKVMGFRCHGVREAASTWTEPTRERLEAYGRVLRAGGLTDLVLI